MFRLIGSVLFFTVFSAFAADSQQQAKDEINKLKESIYQKRGVYFRRSDGVSQGTFLEVLKGISKDETPFSVNEGVIIVGEKNLFKVVLERSDAGPEYAIDSTLLPKFIITVDASMGTEKIVKFLSSLPVEEALAKFIKEELNPSEKYIKTDGIDFYLVTLMAVIDKYYSYPSVVIETANAMKKFPDPRLTQFINDFKAEHSFDEAPLKAIDDLAKTVLDAAKPAEDKPAADCSTLPSLAETIAKSSSKPDVAKAIDGLSAIDCKEAVAYLFFLDNMSYVNKGEDLFGNPDYFKWDKKNSRYSVDLRRKEEFSERISAAWRRLASKTGIPLNEAFRLLATKYEVIFVGPDSLYYRYLFRIPYLASWELGKKEFYSLVDNSLFADSGYVLKKSGKIYQVAKVKQND